jgi:hypothetical protein
MTAGFAWAVAATLALFILASFVALVSGLLDDPGDSIARSFLFIVYAVLFLLPTGMLWLAFWYFGSLP